MNNSTVIDSVAGEGMKKNNDWEGWKQIPINMIIMMNNDAWGDDDGEMMTMPGTGGLHMGAESLLKNSELIIVSKDRSYTSRETHTSESWL